jgi:hypothetical protein
MLKKIALTISIIAACSISHSEEITSVLDKKFVVQLFKGNSEITFNKKNIYEVKFDTDGMSFSNKGKYSIKNNVIYLEPDTCSAYNNKTTPCNETLGRAECRLIDDNTSLYYSKFIECTSLEKGNHIFIDVISLENKNSLGKKTTRLVFPLSEYKVKSGAEIVYDGIPVIALPGSSGITTMGVKIREKPSTSSKALKYWDKIAYDMTAKEYDSVPKGTPVQIIARTKDKFTVDKWDNYWYLVSVGANSRVWMYGEFIKIK